MLTDEQMEKVARALCRLEGFDPDTQVFPGVPQRTLDGVYTIVPGLTYPLWATYRIKVLALLRVLVEVGIQIQYTEPATVELLRTGENGAPEVVTIPTKSLVRKPEPPPMREETKWGS